MRKIIIMVVAISLIHIPGISSNDAKTIPFGQSILPNGFVGEREWEQQGAIVMEMDSGVVLFLSQDSQYVYIGVQSTDTQHTGVDLYVQTDQSCAHRLHISSAHGQSEKCDTAWTEMDYCENRLWTSNIVESIFVDGKNKYIAPEIFEYMIDKKLLPGEILKLMVHLKRPEKIVPAGADPDSFDSWYSIRMH